MAKIGLFFATDTGNTRKIAKIMKRKFFEDDEIELVNFEKATAEQIDGYSALIFGSPTLGDGEYPEPLLEFLPNFDDIDFSTKTVALYGLGDQEGYPDEFVDALGMLYEELEDREATLIGQWPTDGYTYDSSKAEMDGEFCGLVLDQDNQSSLTEERLAKWVEMVKPLLLAAAGDEAAAA